MDHTPEQLAGAIAALEAQRGLLGDAVVDMALAPLRQQLDARRTQALPQQQLKQVSVLFVDVVGSTAMGQQLGQLVIGNDSTFDLSNLQIIFSFIGNTNPNEFAASDGGFNLDKFLLAGGANNTISGGLSSLFGNEQNPDTNNWGEAVNSNLFALRSTAYDVSGISFNADTGEVTVTASAIPEPVSIALVLLALTAMLMASRRRHAARRA